MDTFKVQFFSPDNQIQFGDVVSLTLSGLEGEFMILANHAPYLIYILPGIVTVKINNQQEEKIVIDNGILEVADNNCSIIASHVHIFDNLTHDEKSFKDKRANIYLSYLDGKSL
ncbi:F0F1 ATP synthase subunit epsilon [Wolbachia endosymbiont of Folsomia candida]|uniref:F0F1 ATP synthase subunit epsilon n=1 Tax=Wolbachia endosymbiont of Folsomia candida TaxID=169402 RepID=UPI000B14D208|nr:F0F1 ATP synthase subunit epsilon [Wolbachia endosymbiont of Folsomia candida]APR98015.1 F0F1 ATP synthase subunit epsilon [Wolbachia endosymbiont of Folsomia candida]